MAGLLFFLPRERDVMVNPVWCNPVVWELEVRREANPREMTIRSSGNVVATEFGLEKYFMAVHKRAHFGYEKKRTAFWGTPVAH